MTRTLGSRVDADRERRQEASLQKGGLARRYDCAHLAELVQERLTGGGVGSRYPAKSGTRGRYERHRLRLARDVAHPFHGLLNGTVRRECEPQGEGECGGREQRTDEPLHAGPPFLGDRVSTHPTSRQEA